MFKKLVISLRTQDYDALCKDAQKDLRPLKLHVLYLIHMELERRGLFQEYQTNPTKQSESNQFFGTNYSE